MYSSIKIKMLLGEYYDILHLHSKLPCPVSDGFAASKVFFFFMLL